MDIRSRKMTLRLHAAQQPLYNRSIAWKNKATVLLTRAGEMGYDKQLFRWNHRTLVWWTLPQFTDGVKMGYRCWKNGVFFFLWGCLMQQLECGCWTFFIVCLTTTIGWWSGLCAKGSENGVAASLSQCHFSASCEPVIHSKERGCYILDCISVCSVCHSCSVWHVCGYCHLSPLCVWDFCFHYTIQDCSPKWMEGFGIPSQVISACGLALHNE